jgi:hypothetical protein
MAIIIPLTRAAERLSVEPCVNAIVELAGSRRSPDRTALRSALADALIVDGAVLYVMAYAPVFGTY